MAVRSKNAKNMMPDIKGPVIMPCVKGNLYEGEERRICPKCEKQLMWYYLPNRQEILACSSSNCVYPFDAEDEDEPYNIRPASHGKTLVSGVSLPDPAENLREPVASSSKSAAVIEYGPDSFDDNLVVSLLQEFMSKPPNERKPEYVQNPLIDIDSAKCLQTMLASLNAPIDE